MSIDSHIHEQAAAYALDALDADERRAFEAHLDGCARCREEVASFGDAVLALAGDLDDASGPVPSAALRARVLAAAAAEPLNVVPIAEARRRREGRLGWAGRPQVLAPAFAVAAAAAVALGVWGASASDSLDRERAAHRSDAGALAAFADPAATRASSGDASLAVAGGRGALSLAKLAPAPAGKTYQAWVIPAGGKPIPAGLFDARGGKAVLVLTPTVGPGAIVAITLEPAGGSPAPTTTPLIAVKTSLA